MDRCCQESPAPLEPFREAMATYDVGVQQPPDPLFYWNSIATDAYGYDCGLMASRSRGGDLSLHRHDTDDLELCRSVAANAEGILKGINVGHGDEGDHPWVAFIAPAIVKDGVVGGGVSGPRDGTVVSWAALVAAMHGALWPSFGDPLISSETAVGTDVNHPSVGASRSAGTAEPLTTAVSRLREDITAAESRGEADDASARAELAALESLLRYFTASTGLSAPTYLRPSSGDYAQDNGMPVVPHFLVCETGRGSIVGVSGLTVWT